MSIKASSLVDAKRQAVVDHVVNATRRHVMVNGLDATMDELADAGGVSRRTLFRLFGTRERLIAAAFDAGMADYNEELPPYEGDPDRWLRATCEVVHRMNSLVGPGFFELSSRPDLPPELAATERKRRRRFRAAMTHIADELWQATGGTGKTPAPLVAAVSAHLSAHFTAAVMTDAGQNWQLASDLACRAISGALDDLER